MRRWSIHAWATFGAVLAVLTAPAMAQKYGGILRSYSIDSPASLSIHEEVTIYALRPVMGVFNNLVMYDQHVKQNSMTSIVPDLAVSWAWDEDGVRLTFKLHEGVKWHDGQPFTARDVKCTWDLLQGKTSDKLRINPRKAWYRNLEEVSTSGDLEVTFRLKRPQPAFLALLASGFSPVYPCHVSPRDMRQRPVGTGPFKLVEFKPNESIKLVRNPDYWKPGRPYLDGLEYTIIRNVSTAILTFVSGKFDITFGGLSVPLTRDVQNQAPQAVCELNPTNVSRNLVRCFQNNAPMGSRCIVDFVAPSVDDWLAIDVVDEGQQSFLEFVFGVDADVAQDRTRQLGEEALNEIEP
jgi:peptide/nickel transport system substrate-binding protein